ncbi:MAG: GDP-mannose 4,6-dehydratase [Saprospiraceae bacterium]|nr:GDP-mannose 4,6-dehydratase [Saprospiraceae bacterium]
MRTALITGIAGQDGSYLAELLLEKGYEVHGLVRKTENKGSSDLDFRLKRLEKIIDKLIMHDSDITSYESVERIFELVQPHECYHLAAQSSVESSFETPFSTFSINIDGTHHMLAVIRTRMPQCRFYFAASSEMYGNISQKPLDECTPFMPQSPYAISKVAGFYLTQYYRQAYGVYSCSGILFNHESPRRGIEFVTQKIVQHAILIEKGKSNLLVLGNIAAKRDWGYAKEYVKIMWRMLQQENPEDFVIGTGESYSIKQFIDLVFEELEISYELVDLHMMSLNEADKQLEILKVEKDRVFVVQHPRFYRPLDLKIVRANPAKAKQLLAWEPQVGLRDLIQIMIQEGSA